jgi:hypothetical protein
MTIMNENRRYRISSLTTVMIVLILTIVLELRISFSTMFGALNFQKQAFIPIMWLVLRVGSVLAVVLFWKLNLKKNLLRTIIFATGLLTVGLVVSTMKLIETLSRHTNINALALLSDVVFLAIVNVLTFSIWYWLIDPPGIDETQPTSAPWEFLFPQRADTIPGYEAWSPRYTDYLALAFTTSVAFSPTDALPLTRRAKALMVSQAAISIISITVIAGSAINILG